MKRRLATLAASAALLVAGAVLASTASAREAFSVSIGAPGFAVGYSSYVHPRAYVYAAPPVVYAPPVAYYGAPVAYPPVVYGPRVVYARPFVYHRPHWHGHWHR